MKENTYFPSSFTIDEEVQVNLESHGIIKPVKIKAVHFEEGKLYFDLLLHTMQYPLVMYKVDSVYVEELGQKEPNSFATVSDLKEHFDKNPPANLSQFNSLMEHTIVKKVVLEFSLLSNYELKVHLDNYFNYVLNYSTFNTTISFVFKSLENVQCLILYNPLDTISSKRVQCTGTLEEVSVKLKKFIKDTGETYETTQ